MFAPLVMSEFPQISVIIPVFERKTIFATISFLRTQSYARYLHFLIIDNGNKPELASKLHKLIGCDCQVLRLERNRGGAGAYRAGMQKCAHGSSEFIWLLDDDARINKETLPNLIGTYQDLVRQGIKVGTVGSMVVDCATPAKVIELGSRISRFSGRINPECSFVPVCNIPKKVAEVDYVPAVSCLVRRETVAEVGVFADLFIHWDDIEWQFRLQRHGYRNFSTSQSIIQHVRPHGKRSRWLWYYDARNQVWFFINHRRYLLFNVTLFWLARGIVMFLCGRCKEARLVWLGIYHAFKGELLMRDELPFQS